MYGKVVSLCKEWLASISHFEVNLPKELLEFLPEIEFKTVGNKILKFKNNLIMTFNKPLTIYGKYRVVPCFTDYAISNKGELILVKDGSKVETRTYKDVNGKRTYPTAWIKNPDKGKSTETAIHRLVALAWVKNSDWLNKFIVNHKDGNRQNPKKSNLEWVSVSENNNHAFSKNLRNDNQLCFVRSVVDGVVHKFQSISKACEFMGVRLTMFHDTAMYLRKHKLFKGVYEVKLESDKSPWFYENRHTPVLASRYIFDVAYEDGSVEKIFGTRELIKRFKLFNIPTSGMKYLIGAIALKRPNVKISVTDFYMGGDIEAMNIENGSITTAKTIKELSEKIGVHKKKLRDALLRPANKVCDGYLLRRKTNDPWPTDLIYEKRSEAMRISAKNTETNEVIVFDTLTKAAAYFNVDRSVIKLRLKNKKLYNGWMYEKA